MTVILLMHYDVTLFAHMMIVYICKHIYQRPSLVGIESRPLESAVENMLVTYS